MSELDVSNVKTLMNTIEPIVVLVPLLELLVIREAAYKAEETIRKAERSLKLLGHQLLRDRELAHGARAILRAYMNRPTTEDTEDTEMKHVARLLDLREAVIHQIAEADKRITVHEQSPLRDQQKSLSLHVSRAMLAGERVGLTRAIDALQKVTPAPSPET